MIIQVIRVVPGASQVTVTGRDKVRTADRAVASNSHLRTKFISEQLYSMGELPARGHYLV